MWTGLKIIIYPFPDPSPVSSALRAPAGGQEGGSRAEHHVPVLCGLFFYLFLIISPFQPSRLPWCLWSVPALPPSLFHLMSLVSFPLIYLAHFAGQLFSQHWNIARLLGVCVVWTLDSRSFHSRRGSGKWHSWPARSELSHKCFIGSCDLA